MKKRSTTLSGLVFLSAVFFILSFAVSAAGQAVANAKSVEAGATWVVDRTTQLNSLTIAEGASIAAPKGYSVTLTVNGVETGTKPGTYQGNVLLTLTDENVVKYMDAITHYFREALYLDRTGIVTAKSVLPAAGNYALSYGILTGVNIKSTGENFNGILVTDGTYTVKGATIDLTGNGGNDFAGFGAAIMSTGKDTTLIVDGANVSTQGAVRTTFVADKGSNLIVKNSHIQAKDGKLPDDYVPSVTLGLMRSVPWMLGLAGNCRATNLLGDNTTATYINSDISSEGWGVLSIDVSKDAKLTAINSKVAITGASGYDTYSIGNAVNTFLGSEIKTPDYGAVITGGHLIYAASTPETVAKLNTDLKLGLTANELASLTPAQTTVTSGRFGVMMWGDSTVKISDGTIIDTGEATFLDKGAKADIDVDGSKGAQLNPKNGVLLQVIDNDDPGPIMTNGLMANVGVYHDPTEAPAKIKDFDVAATHDDDVIARFSNIALKGDFYNAARSSGIGGIMHGGTSNPAGAPGGSSSGGSRIASSTPAGRNMVLKFEKASIAGVITASTAKHLKDTITPADYKLLGEVKNTPGAAINNGVIVSLANSTWTVTGTSYLTSLTISDGSTIAAPKGHKVTVKVNGARPIAAKSIKPGTYIGAIVLQVAP